MKPPPVQAKPRKRGGIPKGEWCAGCGEVSTGMHLDKELRPKPAAEQLVEELSKIPNPCCGIPGPCRMDDEFGPVCHCGVPSTEQSGLCGSCFETLRNIVTGQTREP